MADKKVTLTCGTETIDIINPVILYGATPKYKKPNQKVVEPLSGTWVTFDRGNTIIEIELPFKRIQPTDYYLLLEFFRDTVVFKELTFDVSLTGLDYIDLGVGYGQDVTGCSLTIDNLGEMFTRKAPDHYDMLLTFRYVLEKQ